MGQVLNLELARKARQTAKRKERELDEDDAIDEAQLLLAIGHVKAAYEVLRNYLVKWDKLDAD